MEYELLILAKNGKICGAQPYPGKWGKKEIEPTFIKIKKELPTYNIDILKVCEYNGKDIVNKQTASSLKEEDVLVKPEKKVKEKPDVPSTNTVRLY